MVNPDWQRPKDRASATLSCLACGEMFPTEGQDEQQCPVCGQRCTRATCKVSFSSSEGF